MTIQGRQYSAHLTFYPYHISENSVTGIDKAFVDSGANGGICGDDFLVLEESELFVYVSSLAGHQVKQLQIVTDQAVISTHKGTARATFHQMADMWSGKSIQSCIQMEQYGAVINDKSVRLPGGKQYITMDGYQIPLDINNGIPYLRCCKPTTDEIASLLHVIMTSDMDWDPHVFDSNIDDLEAFFDVESDHTEYGPFDQYGDYRHRVAAVCVTDDDEFFDNVEPPE